MGLLYVFFVNHRLRACIVFLPIGMMEILR